VSNIAFEQVQTAGSRPVWRALRNKAEARLDAESAQLPLWIPVMLGLGIALWFTLPDPAAWTAATACALGSACAGWSFSGRVGTLFRWGGLLVAAGIAIAWVRAEQVATGRLNRPVVAAFVAEVQSVEHLSGRGFDRLRLQPRPGQQLPPLVRVNLRDEAPAWLLPGSVVRIRARLMPPAAPAVPGGYDFARAAWFQGLGATGQAIGDPSLVAPARPQRGFSARLAALRARITGRLQDQVGGGPGGIAASLVTGDQGGVSQSDAAALRTAGLAHLLSISGLHVAAVIGAAVLLTRRLLAVVPLLALRLPISALAAGMGAVAGLGYTLLSGAEVPTVRTCVAALLVLLGFILGREAMSMRLLAAAAFVVLLFRPEALVGPSFQLSFAAVATIIALHEQQWLRDRLAARDERLAMRLARSAIGLLITGFAVELALAPIAIFHFNRTGIYGALANIVAIPFTTFVIMPLEVAVLLFDWMGVGRPVFWLLRQSLLLLIWLARTVSGWLGAITLFPAISLGSYALMMMGGIWLCLWRTRWRLLGVLPCILGATAALLTPKPDLLISGDGRHLALNDQIDGARQRLLLLRPRAGDYTREVLASAAAFGGEATALDDRRNARCSDDACLFHVWRNGRQWTVLATRSPLLIERDRFQAACSAADIVIADRRLPPWCQPHWLKLDRPALLASGAMAIKLGTGYVDSVAARSGSHPWSLRQ
jgi:competence protein ComEC